MDLTYLIVAVFGMCVARPCRTLPTAAAPTPTPSSEQSLQVAAAAEPTDNGKRSRSLFQPPSPHQYQPQDDDPFVGMMDDDDDLPTAYQQLHQRQNAAAAQEQQPDEDVRLSSRARPAGNKLADSPVYFIRLPPQPYVYVPGYGYVSQPTRLEPPPFAQRPHSPFLNLPLGYVSNAKPVGVYTLPHGQQQQQPLQPFQYQQQQQQQQFSGRPRPYKRPQPAPATTPPPPQEQDDSAVYSLDKGPYVFNGRPSDVFLLQSAYDNLYSEVLQNIYP